MQTLESLKRPLTDLAAANLQDFIIIICCFDHFFSIVVQFTHLMHLRVLTSIYVDCKDFIC